MRKIICIIFLLFPVFLYAQKVSKDSIGIYYQQKLMGSMPLEEYEVLVRSAKLYHDELLAENNKRIKIVVKDSQPIVKLGETFTADVHITWMDEKGNSFKEMVLENSIEIKKENLHQYRVLYRDIAEVGFPSLLLVILVIIAL